MVGISSEAEISVGKLTYPVADVDLGGEANNRAPDFERYGLLKEEAENLEKPILLT